MRIRSLPAATLLSLACAAGLAAHPMGNFSVSHYSRIDLKADGAQLTYILDLAEVPTFELLQQWGVNGSDARSEAVQRRAREQAPQWLSYVAITLNGRAVSARLQSVRAEVNEGAGGLPVLRVSMDASIRGAPGTLTLEDRNYKDRTGWKEIVVAADDGVTVARASHGAKDVSGGLTLYPADADVVPPQDLRASAEWSATATAAEVARPARATAVAGTNEETGPASPAAAAHPSIAPAGAPRTTDKPPVVGVTVTGAFAAQQATAPGSVVHGDFLSRYLSAGKFGPLGILMALLVAFGLGAVHALSPGHGKTLVAAYLVGSRGTPKHALFLGLMVMLTHTASVFALGLGVLFFQRYFAPERIVPVLATLSGASLMAIGAWLFRQRLNALVEAEALAHNQRGHSHHDHAHAHHDHGHDHAHPHVHYHHDHDHHSDEGTKGFVHTHSHGGVPHSHVLPEGNTSLGGLIALGASGGLVPCPSALILLLGAIALGHAGIGLVLLTAFSAGLAVVLMAIGMAVLYAKERLMRPAAVRDHRMIRLLPVLSSVVVMIVGLLMTLSALGMLRSLPLLS